jgi:hypothetical protein
MCALNVRSARGEVQSNILINVINNFTQFALPLGISAEWRSPLTESRVEYELRGRMLRETGSTAHPIVRRVKKVLGMILRCCATTALLVVLPLQALGESLPQQPKPIANSLNEIEWYARLLATHHRELSREASVILKATAWLGKKLSTHEAPAYALQLTIDDYLLRNGVEHPADAAEAMNAVAQDLFIKDQDCEKFGHGRLVPVEVRTVAGGTDSSGWQVYYQWVPPSQGFSPTPMTFPSLSSPTSVALPPGLYHLHAEKPGAQGTILKSETVNVPVGGEQSILWKIPVP